MKRKTALFLAVLLLAMECISGTSIQALAAAGVENESQSTESAVDVNTLLRMEELAGWATVEGEGLDGVTGGGDAEPVVVTNLEDFTEAVTGNIPRVVVVSGTIEGGKSGIKIGSNKTVVGADENATIHGGLAIHGQSNVIVANLNIHGCWPENGADDCMEVRSSHHLWFTHLNVWNSWDGNMDITIGCDYVTVSWCKFWYTDDANDGVAPEQDHRLSNLVGSGTGHDDTDMGKLRVTYHHNWFADNLDQRMPRVMYGRVHVYNNYYSCIGNTYCIGADCYASLLVENNYFYKVNSPHKFSYDNGFPASIVARGNKYDSTKGKKESGQLRTDSVVRAFETTVYDYYLNEAEDVPALVQAYAGTQDMSDESTIPAKLKEAKKVTGQEDKEVEKPSIIEKEETVVNDNPVTYDSSSDTYTYHGQNSDGSNGFYTISNPFAGKDLSETPTWNNGKPVWTKGVTISYWVKVPSGSTDVPTLTFNLKERQMERTDIVKYNLCKDISYSDGSYSMGTKVVYVDANGKEYTALEGYGKNVCANPEYPTEGYYYADKNGGAYHVYKKGTDPSKSKNWTYLNYIGAGIYESYSERYTENAENSMIQEADIKGSLCLYASGTMGYRQDNWTGLQRNPNLDNYGSVLGAHIYNQFYYWGNGGTYSLKGSSLKTPTMEKKDEWHFVAVVIQNDWIQYYMDGVEMGTDYLNWWTNPININTASDSFNLGFGQKLNYKNYTPDAIYRQGKTILDFISDEDTVLMIGGTGYCAENLGQNTIKTDSGAQIKNVQFYYSPVSSNCILSDKIDLTKGNSGVESPDKETGKVTLKFDSKGGSSESSISVTKGKTPGKLPVPEKEGYIFDGWYTSTAYTGEVTANTEISKGMTVYAKWVKRPVEVTEEYVTLRFETNGGDKITEKQVLKGTAPGAQTDAVRAEHLFVGWYTNSSLTNRFDPEAVLNENVVLYAAWARKGDLNADGEVSAEDALTVLKRVANMIPDEEFTDMLKKQADVNGSGSIEAEDALMILKYVANMIKGFDTED